MCSAGPQTHLSLQTRDQALLRKFVTDLLDFILCEFFSALSYDVPSPGQLGRLLHMHACSHTQLHMNTKRKKEREKERKKEGEILDPGPEIVGQIKLLLLHILAHLPPYCGCHSELLLSYFTILLSHTVCPPPPRPRAPWVSLIC